MRLPRCVLAFWILGGFFLLLAGNIGPAHALEQTTTAVEEAGTAVDQAPGGQQSALEARMRAEKLAKKSRFSLLPHKPNYLLPVTYNTSPGVWDRSAAGEDLDPVEVKFQVSLKTPIWEDIFGDNGVLYVAYSQLAFWQAYNRGVSSPFREINFEPEAFIAFHTGYEWLGVSSQLVSLGINHQSNGRSEPFSRSWNRLIANFLFQTGNVYLNLRPWLRLPESADEDDNPNMENYYGYGEISAHYAQDNQTLSLLLRNNLRRENKGAVQLDWSFPLRGKIKGYVQFFSGYGESLVDYNHSNTRFGIGVMLTDWL